MRILFDNGTPNPSARSLAGHEVAFARQIGWHELQNGDLLREAEEADYDLLLPPTRTSGTSRIYPGAKSPSSCWGTSSGRTSSFTLTALPTQ